MRASINSIAICMGLCCVLAAGVCGCGKGADTRPSSEQASSSSVIDQDETPKDGLDNASDDSRQVEQQGNSMSYANENLGIEATFPEGFANTSYNSLLSPGEKLALCVGDGAGEQVVAIERDMSAVPDVDTVDEWAEIYAENLRAVMEENDVSVTIDYDKGTLGGAPCTMLSVICKADEVTSYHDYFFFESEDADGRVVGLGINLHSQSEKGLETLENCFHASGEQNTDAPDPTATDED